MTTIPFSLVLLELEKLFFHKTGTWCTESAKIYLAKSLLSLLALATTNSHVKSSICSLKNFQNLLTSMISSCTVQVKRIDPMILVQLDTCYKKLIVSN